jgi:hypothetical protein
VVRELDGAGAGFAAVERALIDAQGADAAAPDAWENAWLAAAALRTRVDSLRSEAAARMTALPTTEADRAAEIAEDLSDVARAHRRRWRSVVQRIAATGVRIAPPDAPPQAAVARDLPAPQRVEPIAVEPDSARVPVAMGREPSPRATPSPRRVTSLTRTAMPVRASARPARTFEAPPMAPVEAPRPAAPERPMPPPQTQHPEPASARPIVAEPVRIAPERVPIAPEQVPIAPERVPIAPEPAPIAPEPVAVARPSEAGAAGRRRLLAVAVAVAIAAIAGSAFAAIASAPGSDGERSRVAGTDDPIVGGVGPDASPGALASSPSMSASPSLGGTITFDDVRIGPLAESQPASVHARGTLEVVAFPTPFDRSLRLTPSSAICVATRGQPARTGPIIAFDAYLAEAGGDGRLGFSLSPDDAGMAVALADLDGVDLERWYRLAVVRSTDEDVLHVADVDTGAPVAAVPLEPDPAVVRAGENEACIDWLTAGDASIFVDDVLVDG